MMKINNTRNNRCWQRCGERGTLLYCWKECKLLQPHREQYGGSSELKIELPNDPVIVQLGIYSTNKKILIQRDICIPTFIAAREYDRS